MRTCRPDLRQIAALGVLSAYCLTGLGGCRGEVGATQPTRGGVYRRVLSSGTIRCSYVVYPPYCLRDPNTGKFSGVYVDAIEEIGRKLQLKVAWTEEVGFGTIFEGLQSDRYDLHCSGLWQNSTRGKVAYFTDPLVYNVIKVWGRKNERRGTDSLDSLNSPDIRIAVQDGAIEDVIAKTDYPKAQRVSIPQLNPWSDNLQNIVTGKADVTFAEPGAVIPFLKTNPGTLKELAPNKPLRVFADSYALKMGEDEFKSMLDSAIAEIIGEGSLERILQKYQNSPEEFYRVALPYLPPPTAPVR